LAGTIETDIIADRVFGLLSVMQRITIMHPPEHIDPKPLNDYLEAMSNTVGLNFPEDI